MHATLRFLLALPALGALGLTAVAQSPIVTVEAGPSVSVGVLGFSHDASSTSPFLGSPTSILEYAPLVAASFDASLLAAWPDSSVWTSVGISVPLQAVGVFRDTDYLVGQTLYSETFSEVGLEGSASGRLALGTEIASGPGGAGQSIRPYLFARIGHLSLAARGLECGEICGVPEAVGPGEDVIRHAISDLEAGMGAAFTFPLSPGHALELGAELALGRRIVEDSHLLRADLGPLPNITYDLGTIRARADLGYTWSLANSLDLTLSGFAEGLVGAGAVTFLASAKSPMEPVPANVWQLNAGAALSAGVSF